MHTPYEKFGSREKIPALVLIFQDAAQDFGRVIDGMKTKHAEFLRDFRGIDPEQPSEENEHFLANLVLMTTMNSMKMIIDAYGECVPDSHIEHVAFQLSQHIWGTTLSVIEIAQQVAAQKAATEPPTAN